MMATNTLPAGISGLRAELAHSALYEIGKISVALRQFIEKQDASGEINPLARGMLARIQKLSEAADECLGNGDDWDDDALEKIIARAGA
jgi:hypothetical protein